MDHRVHEMIDLGRGRGRARDHASGLQHRRARRDTADFPQLVRDEHDGATARRDACAGVEQRVDLGGQQDGGRFVEQQEARLAHQTLDDLDALPFAHRQVGDAHIEREIEADAFEHRPHLLRFSGAIEPAARLAEQQVVEHARIVDQAEVLMDHRDAVLKGFTRIARPVRRAVDLHRSRVGLMHAEDHVAERRLARAVLAEQAVHVAGHQVERDIVERLERAEALADARQREDRRRGRMRRGGKGGGVHPSDTLILPLRMSSSICLIFACIAGVVWHTAIPDAFGPIARPNAL